MSKPDVDAGRCSVDRLVRLFSDEERNALMTALRNAADTALDGAQLMEDDRIYKYVESAPKTSLVSELVDELHRLGYVIQPNSN